MRMIFMSHYAGISIELRFLIRVFHMRFLIRVFHIILYGSCRIKRRIRIFSRDLRLNIIVLWASGRILLLWVCLLINYLCGIHWWSCRLIIGAWIRLRHEWLSNWSLLQNIRIIHIKYHLLKSYIAV